MHYQVQEKLSAGIVLLCLLVLGGPALANSRMVVSVQGVFTVVMDNRPVSSAGSMGRTTLSAVTPGQHSLQLRDPAGAVVYQATIDVPDNASISASWDGVTMTLVGAHQVSSLTTQADADFRDAADVAPTPDDAALQAANDQNHNNQLASSNGQSAVTDTHAVGGRIPYEVSQVAGSVATTAIAMPSLLSDPIVSAVGGSLAYTFETAEAGGLHKRYEPSVRQGNPNVPPPILEDVKLVNVGGQPLTVFIDGMWLHEFTAGQTAATVTVEVGRHELQFMDPARKAVVFEGSLRVKDNYVITLECSPTQAPRATNATWAWAPM